MGLEGRAPRFSCLTALAVLTAGPCALSLATNSPSVDLGTGHLSTRTPPAPATLGVAALAP